MRIIAGTARGKQLKQFRGDAIRPTSDRVREALFSSLTSRLGTFTGLRVLDLFAGTGALGLEALSRGASKATFIDIRPESCRVLRENLSACRFQTQAEIHNGDAITLLQRGKISEQYDLIFADPPYGKGLLPQVLKVLAETDLVTAQTLLVAETESEETIESLPPFWERLGDKRYGRTRITYIARRSIDEKRS